MSFYKTARVLYKRAVDALGDPSPLARLLPNEWVRNTEAFKQEQQRNVEIATNLNEARKELTQKSYRIEELEDKANQREKYVNELEAQTEQLQKQISSARHWKRDVVEAGHSLLQTRAELEVARSGRKLVIAADHRDRVTYASPAAVRTLRYKDSEEIVGKNVYDLLKGTDDKSKVQIKYAVQTVIRETHPERVPLPGARLIGAEGKRSVGANLTLLPVQAGTTYIGTIVRGESREERTERLAAERAAKKAREDEQDTRFHGLLADVQRTVAEQAAILTKRFRGK